MRKFQSAIVSVLAIAGLGSQVSAIPTGDGSEYFPGNVTVNQDLEVRGAVKFTNGAVDGYFLQVDAAGNATWVELPGAADSLAGDTVDDLTLTNSTISGATTFSNTTLGDTSSITFTDSILQGTVDTGTGLTLTGPFDAALSKLYADGVTDPSQAAAVEVAADGKTTITGQLIAEGGLKLTDGDADADSAGQVLTLNADGTSSWKAVSATSGGDFTDTTLTGTTTFQPSADQLLADPDAVATVTGNIFFDDSILTGANIATPTITGTANMQHVTAAAQDAGGDPIPVVWDIQGNLDADSLSSADGSGIQNVTAVGLTPAATVAASQVDGALTNATISGDDVTSKVSEATTADNALALDANAIVGGNQVDGAIDVSTGAGAAGTGTVTADAFIGDGSQLEGIEADGLAADAEIDIAKTTTDILALDPAPTITTADIAMEFVPTNSLMRVSGDTSSPDPTPVTTPLVGISVTGDGIDPDLVPVDGQILILKGTNDDYKVEISSSTANVILNSGVKFVIGNMDTISFVFVLTDPANPAAGGTWIETSRTDALMP